jgi:hypothetical protein
MIKSKTYEAQVWLTDAKRSAASEAQAEIRRAGREIASRRICLAAIDRREFETVQQAERVAASAATARREERLQIADEDKLARGQETTTRKRVIVVKWSDPAQCSDLCAALGAAQRFARPDDETAWPRPKRRTRRGKGRAMRRHAAMGSR